MKATDIAREGLVPMANPTVTNVKQVPQPMAPKRSKGFRPYRSMRRVIIEPQNIKEIKSTPERIKANLGLKPNEFVRMTGK